MKFIAMELVKLSHSSRREFMVAVGAAASGRMLWAQNSSFTKIAPAGPASKYTPVIHAAFVRRKGEYGLRWPGAIYDGESALRKYRVAVENTCKRLGVKLEMRPDPICSMDETQSWLQMAKSQKADGLFLGVLDRQEHAWPTATAAVDSGIPTVAFAPIGTAFTTNTASFAKRNGIVVCSTDDFRQAAFGIKMLKAGAKLREMRFLVLKGAERRDVAVEPFGTKLRYLPATEFLAEYDRTPIDAEVKDLALARIKGATRLAGTTEQDVINGVKSYVVAKKLLEREEADGITMDCLGALAQTKMSLPCIAWSTMLDHGIPAACEADLGASLTHALVQFLFDRPGFQQDPVAETAQNCLIGAHCTCPTRLSGFDKPAEPYFLSYHHGKRDAVPVTRWPVGKRVTVASIEFPTRNRPDAQMIVSAGTVTGNVSAPPSGGCVVSVVVKLDGVTDLLDYPGFHQLFFYGDYKKELKSYCQLYGIKPLIV